MIGIGKILKLEFLGERSPEIQAIKLILKPQVENQIQGLLRRKADEEWPIFLNSHIIDYYHQLDHSYRFLLKTHHSFQSSTIFLPAILAWDMLSEKNDSFLEGMHTAVEIFKIKQLKYFDEDWFNSIFQYLSVWLYQYFKEEERVYA